MGLYRTFFSSLSMQATDMMVNVPKKQTKDLTYNINKNLFLCCFSDKNYLHASWFHLVIKLIYESIGNLVEFGFGFGRNLYISDVICIIVIITIYVLFIVYYYYLLGAKVAQ